jgi:hypothetical protein
MARTRRAFVSLRGADVSCFARTVRITNQEISRMCDQTTRRPTKRPAGTPAAVVFLAASLLAFGSAAFAQDSAPAGTNDPGGTVELSANEGPLHMAVRSAGARLTQTPGPQTTQSPSWVVRHPVITGTLIGAGGGAVLSRSRAFGGANHDPRVMLIGAGAGAWGGLVASAIHKARAREKVSVGTKIGIAAGAVGIIVLPLLACYGAGGCGGVS